VKFMPELDPTHNNRVEPSSWSMCEGTRKKEGLTRFLETVIGSVERNLKALQKDPNEGAMTIGRQGEGTPNRVMPYKMQDFSCDIAHEVLRVSWTVLSKKMKSGSLIPASVSCAALSDRSSANWRLKGTEPMWKQIIIKRT
jgi:hypothetical protein